MKKSIRFSMIICIIMCITCGVKIYSQNPVSWLSDYTGDINTSSYSYKYSYFTVDNKACKLKIEEQKTDKKASTVSKSYIFYLSDLDPSKFAYKPSGSTIIVTLATKSSQKFISLYGNEGLEEYANTVSINFDAVDKARSFIDVLKGHCNDCKSAENSWSSASEAFGWLNKNITESMNSGSSVKQTFKAGAKSYLAEFIAETTDSKGISKKSDYLFNLNDINPTGILLEISGKSLKVVIPVKDNKNYIQEVKDGLNVSFTKEIEILSDDIELARIVINALNYVVSAAKPEIKEWVNYSDALGFTKNNLKEVSVGSTKISNELSFSASTSGAISIKILETDSKGIQTEEINTFYLIDIAPEVKLEVTPKNVFLTFETKEKAKYIKQTGKEKTLGYSSSLKVYMDNIEQARDVIGALEFAIKSGTDGVQAFSSIQKAMDWLNKNPGDVYIDTKSLHQTILFDQASENKMDVNVITSDAAGASVNERFELYPEDISVENLKIKVSGKKLAVPISTGKFKYIKAFKGDAQQSFTDEIEYLFEDVQVAKNFIAAMTLIQQKSIIASRSMSDKGDAYAYLVENIKGLMAEGKKVEQKIEQVESNECKLKYTLTETDSKGASIENSYEFILSDIDLLKSTIAVASKDLKINLVTKEKQKLVKPMKNGEPGNFISNVEIYTDDVLTAKKMLAAFKTLSEGCK
jgi:hypothetical protein